MILCALHCIIASPYEAIWYDTPPIIICPTLPVSCRTTLKCFNSWLCAAGSTDCISLTCRSLSIFISTRPGWCASTTFFWEFSCWNVSSGNSCWKPLVVRQARWARHWASLWRFTCSVSVSPSWFVPALPFPARTAVGKPRAVGTLTQEAYSLQSTVLPSSPFLQPLPDASIPPVKKSVRISEAMPSQRTNAFLLIFVSHPSLNENDNHHLHKSHLAHNRRYRVLREGGPCRSQRSHIKWETCPSNLGRSGYTYSCQRPLSFVVDYISIRLSGSQAIRKVFKYICQTTGNTIDISCADQTSIYSSSSLMSFRIPVFPSWLIFIR